ncbi:MAG: PEP/pyruvate-binding domain-containing protein [Planctomycetota bacterium]|nr:PEP/pyruvate-binding domain-containing protein [Planctomycetota bacterium]
MTKSEAFWVTGADAPSVALAGGKGASLAKIEGAGLRVPEWFCVTTEFYLERVFSSLGQSLEEQFSELDLSDPVNCEAASEKARQLIMDWQWPEEDKASVLEQFDRLFEATEFVSVRSSAPVEDAESASFAGQFDSYLFVRREDLLDSIKKCWASLFSERSLTYRNFKGVPVSGGLMAVLVQRMVDSEVAGVLFTVAPDDPETTLMTAGLGLGEGIVSDQVEVDSYRVSRGDQTIERELVLKTSRIKRKGDEGGTYLEEGLSEAGAALTDSQILELARQGRLLEEAWERPVDMEWGLDSEGTLFVLQGRPITDRGQTTFFDNSNIVESYPGLTLPLTFSCVREFYSILFSRTGLAFGVPERFVRARQRMYDSLVGLVEGRVYYNLPNWYGLYTLVPGYGGHTPAWERMIGLKTSQAPVQKTDRWTQLRYLPVMLWMIGCVIWRFIHLRRDVETLSQMAQDTCGDYDEILPGRHDAHDLLGDYEILIRDVCHRFETTVVNDFFVMTFFDQLTKSLERLGVEDPGGLANDLLCGSRDMASVEPVQALLDWSERLEEASRRVIEERETEDAWAELSSGGEHRVFREQLKEYLVDYGHRQLEELKLETRSLRSHPGFLIGTLRQSLKSGLTMGHFDKKDEQRRGEAEDQFRAALKKQGFVGAWWTRYVLEKSRRCVRYRENLRLARARGFGVLRLLFERMGVVFEREGVLQADRDIFYLTKDEVIGVILGTVETANIKGLVELRRKDYERFGETVEVQERVLVSGLAGLARCAKSVPSSARALSELSGTGCSAGLVRAKARVVTDPKQVETVEGAILVARMTDPGWVFLMIHAGGLIVEKGSLLSHTAIIGRELGIPTIVGVTGATQQIKDGMDLEMDGRTGQIRILEPEGKGEKEKVGD